jgi:hypothetical protein
MLYKFQRPLFSTGSMLKILVYNKSRSQMNELLMTREEINAIFDKEEYKVFWHGKRDKGGKIVLERKVLEKDWPSW